MGRCCSLKQLMKNATTVLVIDRTRPQFLRYPSQCRASYCYDKYVEPQIPSSSLFDGFTKTIRRMSRFYQRTFFEHVPSSLLVRPHGCEETDEAVHFFVSMHDIGSKDIKVSVENETVTIIGEGDGVFEATRGYKKYVCYIDLPDIDSPVKMYTARGVKARKIGNSTVEIVIPKLKQHEKPNEDDNENDPTFYDRDNAIKMFDGATVKVTYSKQKQHPDDDDIESIKTFDIKFDPTNNEDDDSDNEDDECEFDYEYDCGGRHNFSLQRFYYASIRKLLF